MNEVLVRRLVGAAVLFAGAFVVVWLLQGPLAPDSKGNPKAVRYDLREPAERQPDAPKKVEAPPPGSGFEAAGEDVKTVPLAEAQKSTAPKPEPEAKPEAAPKAEAAPDKPKEAGEAPKPKEAPKAESKPKEVAKADTKPKPTSKPAAPAAAPAKPAAKPSSSAPKPATPTKPVSTPPVPPGWYIQAGSFADQAHAQTGMKKLYDLGLKPVLQTVTVNNTLWYRLRVGPYKTQAEARAPLEKLQTKGFKGAKVGKEEAKKEGE